MRMQPETLAKLVVDVLDDLKAVDIRVLDVRTLTAITDFMIVATGSSVRQVKALSRRVVEKCKSQGIQPLGVEGANVGDWVLVDLGDVVVHAMLPDRRDFYQLEKLWDTGDRRHSGSG